MGYGRRKCYSSSDCSSSSSCSDSCSYRGGKYYGGWNGKDTKIYVKAKGKIKYPYSKCDTKCFEVCAKQKVKGCNARHLKIDLFPN